VFKDSEKNYSHSKYSSLSKGKGEAPKSLSDSKTTVRADVKKVGRNEPCPCKSGKKFKKCCGQ